MLAPTRELASQIAESVGIYGNGTGLRHAVVLGGVSQLHQVRQLRSGVDIVIATPGRLIDLLDQGMLRIDAIEMLVLDEFDRMLDQGFLPAIRRVLERVPTERQTLLFSATMPRELDSLVKQIVRDPVRVTVGAKSSTPEQIDQSVWFVEQSAKRALLETVLRSENIQRALVFTRTKHGANRVAAHLHSAGIQAEAIHGNKSQNSRENTLGRFRRGELVVLVATDIAARGIDVEGISHVINFDLPADPETYVHRIGRTARAGRSGAALSLCTLDDRSTLRRIEHLIGVGLRAMNAPAASPQAPVPPQAREKRAGRPARQRVHSARASTDAAGSNSKRAPAALRGAPRPIG